MSPKPSSDAKTIEPDQFDGSNISVRMFLLKLRLSLELAPSAYPTERARSIYLFSHLKGAAAKWAAPLFETDDPVVSNFDCFTKSLEETFRAPNEEKLARAQLMILKQGNDPISIYIGNFRELSCITTWNESALVDHFENGLSTRIKEALITHETPKTLAEFMTLASQVEQKLGPRIAPMIPQPAPAPTPSSTSPMTHYKPTEQPVKVISEVEDIWSKLTPREQRYLHRVKHNLCRYCGSADHLVANCPDKQGKPPLKGKGQSQH
jgi:hypothetical protein